MAPHAPETPPPFKAGFRVYVSGSYFCPTAKTNAKLTIVEDRSKTFSFLDVPRKHGYEGIYLEPPPSLGLEGIAELQVTVQGVVSNKVLVTVVPKRLRSHQRKRVGSGAHQAHPPAKTSRRGLMGA